MCSEHGEQAATKALIFDPLFASVTPQHEFASARHRSYHLEQRSVSASPNGEHAKWELGTNRRSAVRSAGISVSGGRPGSRNTASRGRSEGGRKYVKKSIRKVQKRRENYLRSLKEPTDVLSNPELLERPLRSVLSREALGNQFSARVLTNRNSGEQENMPPRDCLPITFTHDAQSVSIQERVITANPKRYVSASQTQSVEDNGKVSQAHIARTVVLEKTKYKPASVFVNETYQSDSLPQPGAVLRHLPSRVVPTTRNQMKNYEYAAIQANNARMQARSNSELPPMSPLSAKQKVPVESIEMPKVLSTRTQGRPLTTQSVNSTASPQILEQEVDDLLKWTENLQHSDDPLDQSWGPEMTP